MHDSSAKDPKRKKITQVLLECREGDADALSRLVPLVYDELRRLANYYMRNERPGHTLQATVLVHEAYARLVGSDIEWQDRAHFFRAAGQAMRRVLVDHARARRSAKRGGDRVRIALEETGLGPQQRAPDILQLDDALGDLAKHHERQARAIELQFFTGLEHKEIAQVLEVSPATVHRDLTFARAWLLSALSKR